VLAAIYIPVVVILTGCVSQGEEKTLGLNSWHLTLPVSCLRQWLVKLGVSAGVCVVLGIMLPAVLITLTARPAGIQPGEWPVPALVLVGLVGFALSFWAGTFLRSTILAFLATVAGLLVLGACASLGSWLSARGFGIGLLQLVITYFDLPSAPTVNLNGLDLPLVMSVPSVIAAALIQSALQFRRAEVAKKTLWKYPAILAAVVFLVAYSCTLGSP